MVLIPQLFLPAFANMRAAHRMLENEDKYWDRVHVAVDVIAVRAVMMVERVDIADRSS